MVSKVTYPRTKNILLLLQLLGDTFFAFCGLTLAYLIRFKTPLRNVGVSDDQLSFEIYMPLVIFGVMFYILSLVFLKAYDSRILLRPRRTWSILFKASSWWLFLFLAISLVIKFEPSISRFFALISFVTILGMIGGWRTLFHFCVIRSRAVHDRLKQRILVIGWSKEAMQLVRAVNANPYHPYEIAGVVGDASSMQGSLASLPCAYLGGIDALENVINEETVHIALIAESRSSKEEFLRISSICERLYVKVTVVPSFFRIFLSNLRFQSISGVPVLGVGELPVASFLNAMLKRLMDIAGAVVGLALSAPLVLVMAVLLKRESPGPVFYKQVRVGRHGRPFTIYKIRSMRLDADQSGKWTQNNDPRRLKIGIFMREHNIDEVPQFWNVLKGDMSLVGPRPERPEFIATFEREIPHYNPRHEVRPGMTGWAQVNGLRGDTSLVDRISYDLYYIENWTIWFDIMIILMTLGPQKNAG